MSKSHDTSRGDLMRQMAVIQSQIDLLWGKGDGESQAKLLELKAHLVKLWAKIA